MDHKTRIKHKPWKWHQCCYNNVNLKTYEIQKIPQKWRTKNLYCSKISETIFVQS